MRFHSSAVKITLAVLIGGLLVPGGGSPALASTCLGRPLDEAIHSAPAVFVGTVTSVSHGGRLASVRVEEIWKGDVAPEVDVWGGGGGLPAVVDKTAGRRITGTFADRTFEPSDQYLFVPQAQRGNTFRDNACSNTTDFRDALRRYRSAKFAGLSRPPPFDVAATESGSGWLLWVGGLFLLVVLGAVVIRNSARRLE